VQQYFDLVATGILTEDDRVELLEGVIVAMAPHGVAHAAGVSRADYALKRAVGDRGVVRVQLSLVQGEHSVPEPDVTVLPGRLEDYDRDHPRTALLIVEVAESSLKEDRLTKAGIYAAQGIPDYWIVNLLADQVEVYRDPVPAERRFASATVYQRGERIDLLSLPLASVAVDDLLPGRRG
jgi:Uma2 family endonuclease